MFKETVNHLDRLARSVREGKSVHEAANFARWLQFSGYLKIFDLNPSDEKYLTVTPKTIRKQIDNLIYDCGEWFRNNKVSPHYHSSDISEINSKLDLLLSQKSGPSDLGIEPPETLLALPSARQRRAKGTQVRRAQSARVDTN